MKKKLIVSSLVLGLIVGGALYIESDPVPRARTAMFSGDRAPAIFAGAPVQYSFWNPSEDDLERSQSWIRGYIASQRASALEKAESLLSLHWSRYVRQVVGVVVEGRRVLLMRYFPAIESSEIVEAKRKYHEERGLPFDPEWWKTTGEVSVDGGHVDFWITYDVDADRFVSYATNG